MSKRFRLLIILVVLVIAGLFLWPTFRWYFVIPQDQRELALSSNQQIRFYARSQASDVLDRLNAMAVQKSQDPLPAEYAFMIDKARTNYRLGRQPLPSKRVQAINAFARELALRSGGLRRCSVGTP